MNLVSRPCSTDLLRRLFDNNLSLRSGAVVAGGAARLLWFHKLAPLENPTQCRVVTQSDIDVFVYDHLQFETLQNYVERRYNRQKYQPHGDFLSLRYETQNAISYQNCVWDKKYYNIQLIKQPRRDLHDIFDSFDLVNCQFATDGHTVVATAEAVTAWQNQKLVYNYNCKDPIKLDRMLKYLTSGLVPDQTLWSKIITAAVTARNTGFSDADYEF
jgi:hypothetical protein